MQIQSIRAYQVFDSRGQPTVEAEVTLQDGAVGLGLVPSGASTGQFEALELRDGDQALFRGKSVFRAIQHIEEIIAPVLHGLSVEEQARIDHQLIDLDGTPGKTSLGANAILAVSMACARAAAQSRGVPLYASLGRGCTLPFPEIQIIGGGAHANWRTDVQDFLLMAIGATTYEETLEITHNVYHAAGDILGERGKRFGLADEGGYWPEFARNEEAFEVMLLAIERAGYTPGVEAALSLDIAASDLYEPATGLYHFRLEGRSFDSDDFSALLASWCRKYPIVSLEDPFADTDTAAWQAFSKALGHEIQIIGDDLFTTNVSRIREGVAGRLANSVLIKLNQIGTVTETMEAVSETKKAGWAPVISARSGETEDAFISHLAVATDAGQLKVGSFARSERMVKWNECLRIGRRLGNRMQFAGAAALPARKV